MNIESQIIQYYLQDDEDLKEYVEIFEILKPHQRALIDKRMSMDIADIFYQLGFKNKSTLIKECNSIKFLQQCITNEEHKHFTASYCRDRFCPICSHRKSHVESEMLKNIMNSIAKDKNYKNSYLIFITLTQKNVKVGELAEEIDKINNAVKHWFKTDKLFKDTKVKVFDKKTNKPKIKTKKAIVQGTVRHLEITSNWSKKDKDIYFHPHLHIMALVKKSYFSDKSVKQWTTESLWKIWRDEMNLDYNPNVDIRLVRNESDDKTTILKNNLDNLELDGAIKEICKYSTKETDIMKFDIDKEGKININWSDSKIILRELYISLKHKRLLVMTGAFKKTKERLYGKKNSDDLVNELTNEDMIQIFKNRCKQCGSPITEHLLKYGPLTKNYYELGEKARESYKKNMNDIVINSIRKKQKKSDVSYQQTSDD